MGPDVNGGDGRGKECRSDAGELTARTEAGRRMVELAQEHAADFATRAADHDRDNTFVRENFEAMKASGFLAATAPREFGGLGVSSLHDLVVAVSRLARGCPSTAIAANMHLGFVWSTARGWRAAAQPPPQLTMLLRLLGRGRIVVSHAGTEPGGGAISFPRTTAEPVPGGYRINGHKIFATNAEIAETVVVFLRVPDGAGWFNAGTAVVRTGTPGMTVERTWDALGMRGSGSHDIRFTDCVVGRDMVLVGRPLGEMATEWPGLLAVNFPLVAAYVGIAERAMSHVTELAVTRRQQPSGQLLAHRAPVRSQVAEMAVELAVARATLGRAAEAIDAFLARPDAEVEPADAYRAIEDFQVAKLVVNRSAAAVVDRAMAVTGGQSYRTGHLLNRLYRDVRAGGFMQPYSPPEALEFVGRTALGLDPFEELRDSLASARAAAAAG
ncbi:MULTISPECIES: acyl-CoA dehydrogenase family protein [Micromonospora]|uniref:acyl-CoA dehydrogenase family protein n=1 Tax=Micromonospora TaxID=1873 RepID=UPI00189027E9|nr:MULTISPECIES: acyl-CoA dehydrogenase family protein [unclassified Micromonospora]MBF5029999.1 acyl-CoA/acyl-ACP dehydrogenase [Micromonospora sp. ANENR4]MCZ7474971.1 acyl-CoA/acyl-ACP dehydrogenase [Micromonospora sp. WMMC273]WBC05592.1 acyl-CoA/acyl-ACP dehydrogenase [Micromonospora sp. WMMA1976]